MPGEINNDTYKLRNKRNIKNNLGKQNRKNAYIIFKDHKENLKKKQTHWPD